MYGTLHCNKPPHLSADLNTEAESAFIAVFAVYDKLDVRTKFAKRSSPNAGHIICF